MFKSAPPLAGVARVTRTRLNIAPHSETARCIRLSGEMEVRANGDEINIQTLVSVAILGRYIEDIRDLSASAFQLVST